MRPTGILLLAFGMLYPVTHFGIIRAAYLVIDPLTLNVASVVLPAVAVACLAGLIDERDGGLRAWRLGLAAFAGWAGVVSWAVRSLVIAAWESC